MSSNGQSGSGGGGSSKGSHSLAFRVICRPSFHYDPVPLRLDLPDLLVGEDIFNDPITAAQLHRLLPINPPLSIPISLTSLDSSSLISPT
uniref:Uncharacterized protein n=1 Tax=Cannabis sativa TaxID=3483 RepID=A0A803QH41_CANSA